MNFNGILQKPFHNLKSPYLVNMCKNGPTENKAMIGAFKRGVNLQVVNMMKLDIGWLYSSPDVHVLP